MFQFSRRSLDTLATVDPGMQRVAHRALELSPVDFSVTQGRRTRQYQEQLYGKGRTRAQMILKGLNPLYADPSVPKVTNTMASNHLSGKAIDIAPYVGGRLNWDEDGKLGLWPQLRKAFMEAAVAEGVKVGWGGDWHSPVDRPHFELID